MFSPKILFLFPKDSVLSLSMLPQQWGVAAQHALGYFALGRMCPSTQSIIQAYIDQWRSNWCRQDCQHNGTHYLNCPLSKSSWISSDIMNFIFDQICLNITLYFIWSTYYHQSHYPHGIISKIFISRRSQIPTQVRPKSALLTELL